MRRAGFFVSLFCLAVLSFLFESSMVSFPLFLILGLTALSLDRSFNISFFLFLGGLVVDSLRGMPFGSTPFFIFVTMLILFLYEKYFGSRDIMVIIVVFLIAVIIYSILLSYSLLQLTIVGFILLIVSLISMFLIKRGIILR